MKRININIDYEINYSIALIRCLRAYEKLGTEGGVIKYKDGKIVEINKTKNSNLTFKVLSGDENETT